MLANETVQGNLSIMFAFREGDSLSILLFNIVLEIIIRDTQLNRSRHIMNKTQQIIAYSDYKLERIVTIDKKIPNICSINLEKTFNAILHTY